jgi:predicted site-specific integrase-resolvase
MMKPPHHRLVPTNVAALAVGVSEATIRKWVSRGKITRYGAPNCRSAFDIDELTEIAVRRPACSPRRRPAGALAAQATPALR